MPATVTVGELIERLEQLCAAGVKRDTPIFFYNSLGEELPLGDILGVNFYEGESASIAGDSLPDRVSIN